MKKVTTALAAAGLLALGACGGGGSDAGAANNTVEDVNVSADGLTATDSLDSNTLGSDSNAFGVDSGNLANVGDANLTAGDNASANSSGNSQ